MSAYLAVFAARFRVLLQYRAAALAGLGTQIFWGLVRVAIFTGFLRASADASPMATDDVITYLWLTQALLLLLPWKPDPEIEQLVRTGQVAAELVRPVDLYAFWYARAVAQKTAPAVLRCLPMIPLAVLLFGMDMPADGGAALVFLVSACAAVLLSAAITTLISISLLFTTSAKGVQMFSGAVVNFASGALVPIALLPAAWRPLLDVLPFRGLMDTPFRLWLGDTDGWVGMIAHQLGWTLALALVGRLLVGVAVRRMEVHGG
jgi:ABC-2 type transport system permease protein